MKLWKLWKSEIVENRNCVNQELCKLGIVKNWELWKLENCGIRTKCYPVCYKFYLLLATVYRKDGDTQHCN